MRLNKNTSQQNVIITCATTDVAIETILDLLFRGLWTFFQKTTKWKKQENINSNKGYVEKSALLDG